MDERTLIRQMKSGNRSSFDRIYELYHVPLFRSAYLICGNREDAEDVLQDTFVTCWLCIGQLRHVAQKAQGIAESQECTDSLRRGL